MPAGDVMRGLRLESGENAHRQGLEDHHVHHIEEARPGALGPWVHGIGLGDDRRKLRLDLLQLPRSLQVEQIELGFDPLRLIGNDLVDDRGDGRKGAGENGHGCAALVAIRGTKLTR